jgi:hypothetical protein
LTLHFTTERIDPRAVAWSGEISSSSEARAGGPVLIGMTSARRMDQDIPRPHRMKFGTIALRVRSFEQDADLEQIMLMSRDAQRRLMYRFAKAKPVDSDLVTSQPVRGDSGCHDTSQLLLSLYPECEEN